MNPRRILLTAVLSLDLGFVAAHHVRGVVPMWAYLLLGSGVVIVAIAILRREHALAAIRSAARSPDPQP